MCSCICVRVGVCVCEAACAPACLSTVSASERAADPRPVRERAAAGGGPGRERTGSPGGRHHPGWSGNGTGARAGARTRRDAQLHAQTRAGPCMRKGQEHKQANADARMLARTGVEARTLAEVGLHPRRGREERRSSAVTRPGGVWPPGLRWGTSLVGSRGASSPGWHRAAGRSHPSLRAEALPFAQVPVLHSSNPFEPPDQVLRKLVFPSVIFALDFFLRQFAQTSVASYPIERHYSLMRELGKVARTRSKCKSQQSLLYPNKRNSTTPTSG